MTHVDINKNESSLALLKLSPNCHPEPRSGVSREMVTIGDAESSLPAGKAGSA
ncbi:hypothetical protein KKG41_06775 [Patescibacteria group bacterium]|nr:hypothetical protein [Patescibacteria group bacterium]